MEEKNEVINKKFFLKYVVALKIWYVGEQLDVKNKVAEPCSKPGLCYGKHHISD